MQDLFVAHVGDSGAFVVRDGAARRLTLDHKPTNPAEQKRIAEAGGRVGNFVILITCLLQHTCDSHLTSENDTVLGLNASVSELNSNKRMMT